MLVLSAWIAETCCSICHSRTDGEAHPTGTSPGSTYRRPDRFRTCQRGRGNKVTRLRPAQTIGGQGLSSLASGLIVATLIIVFLYVGREILEPLVIAVLIGFILAPLIRRLRNLGLWRVPSVILAVLFATAVIGALGSTIVMQVAQLADDLPKYETNLRAKIRAFGGGALTSSALERASGALKDLASIHMPMLGLLSSVRSAAHFDPALRLRAHQHNKLRVLSSLFTGVFV